VTFAKALNTMPQVRRFPLVFLVLSLLPSIAQAQQSRDFDASRVYITRQELMEMAERHRAVVNSSAYSGSIRNQSKQELKLVEDRLEFGDFQTGDRIWLVVEAESALTDTFTVRDGPALALPDVGNVPLQGVLRAELQGHLTNYLSRFIRNPIVHVKPMIPVTVVGGVTTPGFYVIPTDAVLTDALMRAGGPLATAKINEITIQRDQRVLWDQEYVAKAIVEGQTIDQMSLRAGDQIIVPQKPVAGGGVSGALGIVLLVVSIPATIFGLTRIR
jgi:protein involved in polysaccharide export with SLBB domain